MKTEVYSWRLSPHLKSELQEAARAERKSLSDLLEEIAKDWLQRTRHQSEDEEERQRRLHEAAMKCAGTIDGGRPDRAESIRSEVRARIARRYER
jgi:hypothetical protein